MELFVVPVQEDPLTNNENQSSHDLRHDNVSPDTPTLPNLALAAIQRLDVADDISTDDFQPMKKRKRQNASEDNETDDENEVSTNSRCHDNTSIGSVMFHLSRTLVQFW